MIGKSKHLIAKYKHDTFGALNINTILNDYQRSGSLTNLVFHSNNILLLFILKPQKKIMGNRECRKKYVFSWTFNHINKYLNRILFLDIIAYITQLPIVFVSISTDQVQKLRLTITSDPEGSVRLASQGGTRPGFQGVAHRAWRCCRMRCFRPENQDGFQSRTFFVLQSRTCRELPPI